MAAWYEPPRNKVKTNLHDWLPILILAVLCFLLIALDIHV